MKKSGCILAWEFCHPGEKIPELLLRVEDRDLWRQPRRYTDTNAASAYLFSLEYTFENWDSAVWLFSTDKGYDSIMTGGEAIVKKHNKDCRELIMAVKQHTIIGGYWVPIINVPYMHGSEACNMMLQDDPKIPFCGYYWDSEKGRNFGLRSPKGGVNVGNIATKYGKKFNTNGGGHINASGFTAPKGWLGDD